MGKAAALTDAVAILAVTPTAALKQDVRDGKFAFPLTRVDIGTPNVGIHTAQDVFVFAVQVLGAAR